MLVSYVPLASLPAEFALAGASGRLGAAQSRTGVSRTTQDRCSFLWQRARSGACSRAESTLLAVKERKH